MRVQLPGQVALDVPNDELAAMSAAAIDKLAMLVAAVHSRYVQAAPAKPAATVSAPPAPVAPVSVGDERADS